VSELLPRPVALVLVPPQLLLALGTMVAVVPLQVTVHLRLRLHQQLRLR